MHNYTLLEKFLFLSPSFHFEKMKQEVDGKTVLITGASSGIGKAFAYLLADTTAHLILVARSEASMNAMKDDIEQVSARVTVFPADLRNEEERIELLAFLNQLPDGLDVVVSNAGISINRPIVQSLDRYHDFTRTMALNYFAPVQLLLSLIPMLARNNGQIINVSSINVLLLPIPYWAAYQASKTAFDTWLRSAEPELKVKNIYTTSIYLPLVRTPMIEPTIAYQNSPAMSPVHVAEMIGHALYTKRNVYKPWWLILGQWASVVFRSPLSFIVLKLVKKKERDRRNV
ncbi:MULTISPECIES: SDR family NAD(P)-dependent oxidoreductase [Exiguobacterium]|uniref:SDR family NAD(P)-dependent oxidoreductase n=1 Tax=Exiguobacterium TaxID=33986 RepID=UPI001BEC7ABA|nr:MULTISPECIES: SDR family NAD(P)-dependent oxidoreductase [Exiguobacterium]MCT4775808.1 SDR family NAD(P)-dependent oxidoreductase [Exiguobacterium aquaticum]MCT4788909.1 SDR family NAD(P)-dependent oxidoreductase [Exiguobacterium mexicanum]